MKQNEYKRITGFNNKEELAAYEKGRSHEQTTIIDFIIKWNGETNSHLGQILHNKLINKPSETTNEEPKLSQEEFICLREALYTLRTSDSPSAYQAKEHFSTDEVLLNMINKLRRLIV